MKSINRKKSLISFIWLLLTVFFLNQLPGLSADNTVNKPIIREQPLKNVLTQDFRMNNLDRKMYSMENIFNAFPESATIDLTLRDVDLASVLRIIAKEGGKNIIIDKSIQGTISAELKKVSLNEAMQTILTGEELEARVDGDTIFVASRPSMATKGLNRKFVKAFKLNNSNAVDVAKILEASIFNKGYRVNSEGLLGQPGSVMQAVSNPNSVQTTVPNDESFSSSQATTGQSNLVDGKTIRGKIEKLSPGDGFNDSGKLASQIKLQSITSTFDKIDINNNDGGAIVIPDTRTNSLLIAGLQEDINLAEQTIKYLDRALSQVSLKVSLIEINKNDTDNLGLSFSTRDGKSYAGFNSPANSDLTVTPRGMTGVGTATNQSSFMFSNSNLSNIASNWAFQLNALVQKNKAKILANPNVLALDGSESLVKITDQIVSRMTVTSQATTGTVVETPEFADVGIVLNILPKIGNDGYVTMRIRPSITASLGKAEGLTTGFANLISTREVLIQDVRVKSGETLAIAGLMRENEVEQIGKLPYASNLPIFGKLFTNRTKNRTKTELIILITPKIVSNMAESAN